MLDKIILFLSAILYRCRKELLKNSQKKITLRVYRDRSNSNQVRYRINKTGESCVWTAGRIWLTSYMSTTEYNIQTSLYQGLKQKLPDSCSEIILTRNENKKLLEVANLNRPPPVKMFLEKQDYIHNIEFNYMRLQRLDLRQSL